MSEIAVKRIPVTPTTHNRLAKFCGKARTYDEAINELLDYWDKKDTSELVEED